MRDEAPLYYDEEEDFYALTRHEDVAAALKDYESFSSARGCDLGMVRSGEVPQKSIIFMDPPDHRHMRSLLNKAFTPRAIQSQQDTVIELIEHYLSKADPDHFDVVQDFSGPFPVEVITRMAGVPEDFRQQVRHWIDTSLHREPGQIELDEDEHAGQHRLRRCTTTAWSQERRENPQDDMISRLIAAEIPDEDGELRKLDDIEITGFTTAPGRRGRRDRHQARRQCGRGIRQASRAVAEAARRPQQDPRRGRGTAALCRPGAVQRPLHAEGRRRCPAAPVPAGKPVFLMGAAANRDPRRLHRRRDIRHRPRPGGGAEPGLGYGIHSCLGAALARMESAIALEHLLDFMPRYEVDFDGLRERQHAERRRLSPRPGEGLAMKDRSRLRAVRKQRGVHGHHPGGVRPR